MKITAFLSQLHSRGIALRLEGGQLQVAGPDGALTPELREQIDARRGELIDLLGEMSSGMAAPSMAPMPRVPRDRSLPLSFAQQRFWMLAQLEGDLSAYDTKVINYMRGDLDVGALEWSIGQALRWQEILRTTYTSRDGEPVQVIAPPGEFRLEVVDMPATGDARRAAVQYGIAMDKQPFDLETGPLYRIQLLRFGPREHALVVKLSHAVTDGHSTTLFMTAVNVLYSKRVKGEPAELPEPPVQYADYAAWQRSSYERDGQRLLSYWKRQLADLPTIDLPTDRPRPALQTFNGARRYFAISKPLAERLKALARVEKCTFFVATLAAFDVLLARYCRQEDIVVGTPIANRGRAETELLMGPVLNTVVLRVNLAGNPSFRELLRRVREVSLGAISHQEMPFEQLVAELKPKRDLSRNPLFQVLFNLLIEERPELTGLEVEPLDAEFDTSTFDLSLTMSDEPPTSEARRGPTGFFEYNTDLFDAATIERLEQHYLRLLQAMVADPDRCVFDVPILTDDEQRLVDSYGGADTARPYPKDRCFHQLFEARAASAPTAVAAVCGDDSLTYAELNERANRLAHHLRALGAGPGVLVGICVERSLDMLVGLLGILKAGAAYVPLDPNHPAERLAFMVEDAGMQLLVTQEHLRAQLPASLPTLVRLDADAAAIAARSAANPTAQGGPTELAYVIYTSGSTGRPKGVQVEHRSLVNLLFSLAERPGMAAGDVMVAVATISFDVAGAELYLPLLVGGTAVIATADVVGDGRALAELLRRRGATMMQATPATWLLLLESGWRGQAGLRVVSTGEALPRELAERLLPLVDEVWNMYGPTETTVYATGGRVESGTGRVPLGRPVANSEIHLLDSRGQPVPTGVAGQLYVGGDCLARGYWRRPELTAEKFVAHPFRQGARLYDTGDLARVRNDGQVEFLGRVDHQVKVRGFRIELGEIEHVLATHDSVKECAVVAHTKSSGDVQLVAHVVLHPGASPTVSELRAYLRGQLPDYMVPPAFVMLDELPLTPSGKVDRKALAKAEGAQVASAERYVPPRTPTEKFLAQVWQEVLGIDQVSLNDNFFDLGGHSLLAMKVLFRVEQELGERLLPMELLIQTLGQFAETCDKRRSRSAQPQVASTASTAAAGSPPDEPSGVLGRLRKRLRRSS